MSTKNLQPHKKRNFENERKRDLENGKKKIYKKEKERTSVYIRRVDDVCG